MTRKTISIDPDVYTSIRSQRQGRESLSATLRRLVPTGRADEILAQLDSWANRHHPRRATKNRSR
jgi:predicted CopG family antitoxin